MSAVDTIIKVIKVAIGIIEVLLGLNVILKLLGALPNFFLFEWIYIISEPFKAPFLDTFGYVSLGGRFVLDLSAIFAMIAYLVIGFILISILKYSFKSSEHKK